MRPLHTYAARSRITWLLWMLIATVPVALLSGLQVLLDAAHSVYATWHWQYKYDVQGWLSRFGERHRNSIRSLAARPEAAGTYLRTEPVHIPAQTKELQ